ncbi:virB8 family protein [Phyllobacterium sp. YR531]|uniref:virB8 family protein n=1 Tax=Phyllobacterium sp. YR531 TaxID=1144343 RepID=UPI00026F642B|nr:virB8 family protein [Phyllobacterium sp. YR531]EJN02768.1 type IV secretory pathway, component VirB8 [Phyllobacterium sp. YR531]
MSSPLANEAESGVPKAYFSEAIRWENDVIRSVKRSRAIAWVVAAISAGLTAVAMGCLAMLLPLKSFEPYVIEVDKTTGFMEIKRPLAEGDLTQNEAITRMNVVRYLRARETYDPVSVQEDFDLAQMLSTGDAGRDLLNLYSPSSPSNPVNLYGRETRILPVIKSIQIPNSRTAIVRFSTQRIGLASSADEHWVALMHFRYTRETQSNEWRFDNPLGFQITDYRRDQESLSPSAGTQP